MERLNYNPDTGHFFWNNGKKAGTVTKFGYLRIGVKGKYYMAHRLAFYLLNGEWPNGEIDHINRNKLDNRISNLRIVDRSTNMKNIDYSHKGKTGVTGVKPFGKKFKAELRIDGKKKYFGLFNSIEEAKEKLIENCTDRSKAD